jgi:hypothetical protein
LSTTLDLPGFDAGGRTVGEVAIGQVDAAEIERRWDGAAASTVWATRFPDGEQVEVAYDGAGTHLIVYGDRATFLMTGAEVLCAPAEPADPAWQRFLLDTVLHWVALAAGYGALHAAAVERHGAVVALLAASGGGKSTLLAELVRRGNRFFADDITIIERTTGGPLAHPGPAVANLALGGTVAPEALGTPIAQLEDEAWVAVREPARAPAPLGAVVLLERRPGAVAAVTPLDASPLDLILHSLHLSHLYDEGRRFQVLSDVVSSVPLLRLTAALEVTPAVLAEMTETAVDRYANPEGSS